MYTITQDKKNIDGVVKTTYGIKCDEVSVKDVSPNKKEHRQNAYVLFSYVSCGYLYSYGKPEMRVF